MDRFRSHLCLLKVCQLVVVAFQGCEQSNRGRVYEVVTNRCEQVARLSQEFTGALHVAPMPGETADVDRAGRRYPELVRMAVVMFSL